MSNRLRELRLSSEATPQEMVDIVRVMYPKYDRTLQSKCEHTEDYGVELTYSAFRKLVIELLGKSAWDQYKRRTDGNRKNQKRIMIRMDDETYRRFMAQIHRDGFETVQAWGLDHILAYINARSDEPCSISPTIL